MEKRKRKKICGIYKLYWENSPYFYIGGTINLKSRRSEHKYKLKNGVHPNFKLTDEYQKYGQPLFVIVELCDPSELKDKEQALLDENKNNPNCYNISFSSICPTKGMPLSDKTRELRRANMKKWRKENPEQMIGELHGSAKKVIDISTGIVYGYMKAAARAIGMADYSLTARLNPKRSPKNDTTMMLLSDYLTNKECTMEDFLKNRKVA